MDGRRAHMWKTGRGLRRLGGGGGKRAGCCLGWNMPTVSHLLSVAEYVQISLNNVSNSQNHFGMCENYSECFPDMSFLSSGGTLSMAGDKEGM